MSTLAKASHQWANRPDDERFTSLQSMLQHFAAQRDRSRETVVSSRTIEARPLPGDHKALEIFGSAGAGYAPTDYAFGQLCTLVGAPASYLQTLPSPMAADNLNYGLKHVRDAKEVGLLLYKNGDSILRAATGPRYGRIWNEDVVRGIMDAVGDGTGTAASSNLPSTSHWRVPGEFGHAVEVTKANTTLFASDRDMFVFLADEQNRIEVPDRRDGKRGSLARGFFCWNSEVGDATFGFAAFLFDYVCCNRIVWGAREYKELKLRHTRVAPDKFLEQAVPALEHFARTVSHDSTRGIEKAIADARQHRIGDVDAFLANRFTSRMTAKIANAFDTDEHRPMESRWDVVTGITAYARQVAYQNQRVDLEREAGKLLDMVA